MAKNESPKIAPSVSMVASKENSLDLVAREEEKVDADDEIEIGVDAVMVEYPENYQNYHEVSNEGNLVMEPLQLSGAGSIAEKIIKDDVDSVDLSWESDEGASVNIMEAEMPEETVFVSKIPQIIVESPEMEIETEVSWLEFVRAKNAGEINVEGDVEAVVETPRNLDSEMPEASTSRLGAGAVDPPECGQSQGHYATPEKIKLRERSRKTRGKEEQLLRHYNSIVNCDPFQYLFCIYVHYSYGAPLHEVIDFAALLIDMDHKEIIDEFQMYVKPQLDPILTNYCKRSAGICQEAVDHGVTLEQCLLEFEAWIGRLVEDSNGHLKICKVNVQNLQAVLDARLDGLGNAAFCCWSSCETLKIVQECGRLQIAHPLDIGPWLDMKSIFDHLYQQQGERVPVNRCRAALGLKIIGMAVDEQKLTAQDATFNLAMLVCKMREEQDNIYSLQKTYWIPGGIPEGCL